MRTSSGCPYHRKHQPMPNIYVGMDVHQSTIVLAVLPAVVAAPSRVDQLQNAVSKGQRYIARIPLAGI